MSVIIATSKVRSTDNRSGSKFHPRIRARLARPHPRVNPHVQVRFSTATSRFKMTSKRFNNGVKRREPHFSYATPLQQLTDTPQEINGQTQADNQQAAKRLKLMLETGEDKVENSMITDHIENVGSRHASLSKALGVDLGKATHAKATGFPPTVPVQAPPTHYKTLRPNFEHIYGTPTNYMDSMLTKAYRESYRRHKIDPEEYEEAELEIEGHEEDVKDGEESETSSKQTLAMPEVPKEGIETHRHPTTEIRHRVKKRSFKPKNKVSGQRTGLGVIGQPRWTTEEMEEEVESDDEDVRSKRIIKLVPSGSATKVVPTMLGCDIPMPFEDNPSLSSQRIDSLKKTSFPFKPDARLPPLALEHPARIWNVMYHSLEPERQPKVNWRFGHANSNTSQYHRNLRPPANDAETYCANLTVTHPIPLAPYEAGTWNRGEVWVGSSQTSKVRGSTWLYLLSPVRGNEHRPRQCTRTRSSRVDPALMSQMSESASRQKAT